MLWIRPTPIHCLPLVAFPAGFPVRTQAGSTAAGHAAPSVTVAVVVSSMRRPWTKRSKTSTDPVGVRVAGAGAAAVPSSFFCRKSVGYYIRKL